MKHQHHVKALSALLLVLYCCNFSYAQGSLRAMYFPGNGVLTPSPTATTNSYVDLGTALKDSLALSNFTIELWVKMGATNSVNPVIIGDKDWASGANTGFILSYYASTDASSGTAAANTIRFNFKPASGTRVDYDIAFPASIAQHWNHIAITVNRSGSMIGYLNGVATGHAYVAGGENIAADAARSLAGTLPVRLGTDGKTNGYRAPFNGTMDEIRIWKAVRTPQELRNNMCHKLTGSETNLLAYYKMDEVSGTGIVNNATATAGSFNGTWVNNMSRVNSGAAIGDISYNLYSADLSDSSLAINSASKGNFSITSIGSAMQGIHVYEIDTFPYDMNGISNEGTDHKYYGIFPVSATAGYSVIYDYGNYPDAINNEGSIGLYYRTAGDADWFSAASTKDTLSNMIANSGRSGTSEFILGDFISNPLALDLLSFNIQKSADQSKALLTWITVGTTQGESFEIERSADAIVFNKIGNSGSIIEGKDDKGNGVYNFTDASPVSGMNFYRIKVISANGDVKYFPVQSIRFDIVGSGFSLFPNPVNNQLGLNYISDKSTVVNIAIYDVTGHLINKQQINVIPSVSLYAIDLDGLSKGTFLVSLHDQNSNFQTTVKMIKK